MRAERRRLVGAALAAGLFGAALLVALSFGWPRPALNWMGVFVPRGAYPPPAELAARVAVFFAVSSLLLAAAILAARWLLQRMKVGRRPAAFLVLLALVFVAAFAAEAADELVRASGNLTASDSTGLIIDNARMTPHGWATVARRSAVASLFADLVAAAFQAAGAVQRRSRDPA